MGAGEGVRVVLGARVRRGLLIITHCGGGGLSGGFDWARLGEVWCLCVSCCFFSSLIR